MIQAAKKIIVRIIFLSLIIFTMAFVHVSRVGAISTEQKKVFDSGIYYFNVDRDGEANAGSCGTSSTSLTGSDNAEKVWNFLKSKGLSDNQVKGIMGNLEIESGFDPFIQEHGKTPPIGGYGIAQWTGTGRPGDPAGSRRLDMVKGVQAAGISVDLTSQTINKSSGSDATLAAELNYMWKEANDGGIITLIKQTRSVKQAVDTWIEKFERPKSYDDTARLDAALKDFNGFSNTASGIISGTSVDNCPPTTVGSGQNTKYIDGFTVYNQCDPQWADKPYSSSTICVSGCGPSAMAMIITNLTGRSVTPDKTAAYAASQGIYIPGAGSSWNISPVLAKHWGLKATAIGANATKIESALRAGDLVITSGQGPLPFTSGGHFLVIRGIAVDGKWKIGDSAHSDTSDKEWDPSQLLTSMNDGSVYAISK